MPLRDTWAKRAAEGEAPAAAAAPAAEKGIEKAEKEIAAEDVAPAARGRFLRFRDELGLHPHEARTVAEDEARSRLFEEATAAGASPRAAASWIANDLVRELRVRDLAAPPSAAPRWPSWWAWSRPAR